MKINVIKIYYRLPYFFKCILASIRGFQLKKLRSKNRLALVQKIKIMDQWDSDKVQKFQDNLLVEQLRYSIQHVPFYKTYAQNRIQENPMWNPLDITNWPILEKDTIRENPELFLSDEFNKSALINISTSGTTGKPMSFWFTKESLSLWYAIYEYRIKMWNGVSDKDVWANFGGQLVCETSRKKPPYWVWNFSMNQLYLSSYHINSNTVVSYLNALKKYKVTYLLGYVSSIYNLAVEALKQNLVIVPLKLVITNAEPLSPSQRELISKAFQCHVVETYSGCEFSYSANEDPEGKMYVWPEAGLLEIVLPSGEISRFGKGELIATGLVNKAMPLIRYRVGDYLELNSANRINNLPFHTIKEITGRMDDIVISKDGTMIGRLDTVFKFNFNVKEVQIIQEDYTEFTIKILPDVNYSEKDASSIIERMKERIGNDIKIKVLLVNEIRRGSNGKFRAVVSKVKR